MILPTDPAGPAAIVHPPAVSHRPPWASGGDPADAPASALHWLAAAAVALAALNAELARGDSATLVLARRCRAHGVPAARARVTAQLLAHRVEEAPAAERRRRLDLGPAQAIRYRRVRLHCGGRVLSEAENWYVPGRLTPGMNRPLEETDTPFGRAIRDLRFRRLLLAAEPLWVPPAVAGEVTPAGAATVPPHVLRHHALLLGADGVPLSEVVETYRREALFLPEPPR